MRKNRVALIILLLAISLNLVACKSDTDGNEIVDTTQSSSNEIQGDIISTGGNFKKLLVGKNMGASTDSSLDSENEENLSGDEGVTEPSTPSQGNRPPIGLAVIDSKDRVNIEEEKVIGTVEYDTINIDEFEDCGEAEQASIFEEFTGSMQATILRFEPNTDLVAGYFKSVCDKFKIDTSTVESSRGLKVDETVTYDVIVAYNDKYNIYLAVNKTDLSAKYLVKEK